MFSKHTPAWILTGGALLTAGAGAINAVGFLGVHHQALSHLSGPITILSTDLAKADLPMAGRAFLIVFFFFLGCVLSGFFIRQETLKLGRRYGFVLILESLLLVAAVHYLKTGVVIGDCLAAMACGLQNAMATNYSGAIVRTTHMTGIVTDLGLACGHLLRGSTADFRRMRLHATLLGGFFLGGVLGGVSYLHLGYDTLLFPAALTGVSGVAYSLYTLSRGNRPLTPAR